MSYKDADRQDGRKCNDRMAEASFEVEEVEFDPTRRGYTQVTNYFAYYWTPLIGARAALTFERICSFAHGKKEDSYPSIGFLADILGIDRHDLTGRIRRDRREGRRGEYYQKGLIQNLADSGLLRVEIEERSSGPHYKFKVLKYPPLLTPDQLAQLPPRLQRKHQELLDRCQKEREDFARTTSSEKAQGGDGATGGGVTAPQGGGDGATGDLNRTELTAQIEQLSPALSPEEAKVREFYQHIGQPQSSRQKVKAGVKTIHDLRRQGFSLVDILWAMTWIVSHQDLFGGQVYSLALLPQVISQALTDRAREQKATERQRRQHEETRLLEQERARRQRLEELYQSLSPTEQATLRQVAVENLLSSGVEKRFLLEPLVRGEVCRLLEQRNHSEQ